jgi:hypothetical protein
VRSPPPTKPIAPSPPPAEPVSASAAVLSLVCLEMATTTTTTTTTPQTIARTGANLTKIPSPRKNPAQRPTDPGRRGKEGLKGGIKKEPNAQALCRKNLDFFPDDR